MRKVLLFIFAIILSKPSSSQQEPSKLDKAKELIWYELKKDTNNIMENYHPISCSKVDSLFSKLGDDETILKQYEQTAKAEAELGDIGISFTFKKIKKNSSPFKINSDKIFAKYDADTHLLLRLISLYGSNGKTKGKAELRNIHLIYDIPSTISDMKKHPKKYEAGTIEKWKIYQANMELLLFYIRTFVPRFIGWKVTHSYHLGKDANNEIKMKRKEFRFNKEMTEITGNREMIPNSDLIF